MKSRDENYYKNIHPQASSKDFYPNGKLLSDEQIAAIENLEEKREGRYSRKYLFDNGIKINRGGIIKLNDIKTGKIVLYATYKTKGHFGNKSIVLGEGTYGKVKLIQNLHTGTFHALKILKPHPDPAIVTEYFEEAAINNTLNRGELVVFEKINDRSKRTVVNFDRKYYAIQDYFPGQNLESTIADASINLLDRINIAIELVEDLSFIHDHKLIHCDIKADNIRYNPENKAVRIIDFGSAMPPNKSFTGLKGTPNYLAPEIIAKQDYSVASDNFALGRVFKELFAIKESIDYVLPPKYRVVYQFGKLGIKYFEALIHEEENVYTQLTNLAESLTQPLPSARPNLNAVLKSLIEQQSRFADIAASAVKTSLNQKSINKIIYSPQLLDYIWLYSPDSIHQLFITLQKESNELNLEDKFKNTIAKFFAKNNLPTNILEKIFTEIPGLELIILNIYPTDDKAKFINLLNQINIIKILEAEKRPASEYENLYYKIISVAIQNNNKQQLIDIIQFLEKKKFIFNKSYYQEVSIQLKNSVEDGNFSIFEPFLGTRFLSYSIFSQEELLHYITTSDVDAQKIIRSIYFNLSPQKEPINYSNTSNSAKNLLMLISNAWLDSNNNDFSLTSIYSPLSQTTVGNILKNISQTELDQIFTPPTGVYISRFRPDPLHIMRLNYENFTGLLSKMHTERVNQLIDKDFIKIFLSFEPVDTSKLNFIISKIGKDQFVNLFFSNRVEFGEHFFELLAIKEIEPLISDLKLQSLYSYFSSPNNDNAEILKAILNVNHDKVYQYLKSRPEQLNGVMLQTLPSLALGLKSNNANVKDELTRFNDIFSHSEKSMNNSPHAFITILEKSIHPNVHNIALADKLLPIIKAAYSTLVKKSE